MVFDNKKYLSALIFGIMIGSATLTAFAGEGKFELGLRGDILNSGGDPSNDVLGAGIFGRYSLQDDWYIGLAVDFTGGDFEGTAAVAGVVQDPALSTIDATIDNTTFTAWAEKRYPLGSERAKWYWLAGVGVNSPNVSDVSGPTAGGGTFNIKTDASTEFMLIGGLGIRYDFTNKWFLDGNFRVEQHFADWTVTDTASGATGTISDYTAYGLGLGFGFRF